MVIITAAYVLSKQFPFTSIRCTLVQVQVYIRTPGLLSASQLKSCCVTKPHHCFVRYNHFLTKHSHVFASPSMMVYEIKSQILGVKSQGTETKGTPLPPPPPSCPLFGHVNENKTTMLSTMYPKLLSCLCKWCRIMSLSRNLPSLLSCAVSVCPELGRQKRQGGCPCSA